MQRLCIVFGNELNKNRWKNRCLKGSVLVHPTNVTKFIGIVFYIFSITCIVIKRQLKRRFNSFFFISSSITYTIYIHNTISAGTSHPMQKRCWHEKSIAFFICVQQSYGLVRNFGFGWHSFHPISTLHYCMKKFILSFSLIIQRFWALLLAIINVSLNTLWFHVNVAQTINKIVHNSIIIGI